ncbi:hypothetical protein [Blastopirellula marina]|uniref:Carboxypeptidase regulatory-like domain-containing protein n=1 Tax=Blastopirellula marina TaxID=124 RepID=A0A2S8F9G2_9BACT|nr:hypothetical protein [Blastopirellula marina]PQO28803.1 hypothetical protein C5Y98_23790 [Blastopirellula marina]PTL42076.1 hypothetical protein C5Y97_23805 [Blastopirellula marina]
MNMPATNGALVLGIVAICLTSLVGCETPVATHPVTGKVVLANGSPAQGGIIKFRTTSEEGEMVKASGQIQPDGTFQLSTFEDGDGALAGEHEVILFSPALGDGGGATAPEFPSKYRKYETSELKFDVKPGKNDFVIQLKAR